MCDFRLFEHDHDSAACTKEERFANQGSRFGRHNGWVFCYMCVFQKDGVYCLGVVFTFRTERTEAECNVFFWRKSEVSGSMMRGKTCSKCICARTLMGQLRCPFLGPLLAKV